MMKFLEVGSHPVTRLHAYRILFRDLRKTREHYKECEELCFAQMFYGEFPRTLALIALGASAFLLLRAPIVAILLAIIAGLLQSVAVFATYAFSWRAHNEVQQAMRAAVKGKFPKELLDQLKKMTGASNIEQVGPTMEGPDGIFGAISMTPMSVEREDPIERILRESREEAERRAKQGKKDGGVS